AVTLIPSVCLWAAGLILSCVPFLHKNATQYSRPGIKSSCSSLPLSLSLSLSLFISPLLSLSLSPLMLPLYLPSLYPRSSLFLSFLYPPSLSPPAGAVRLVGGVFSQSGRLDVYLNAAGAPVWPTHANLWR